MNGYRNLRIYYKAGAVVSLVILGAFLVDHLLAGGANYVALVILAAAHLAVMVALLLLGPQRLVRIAWTDGEAQRPDSVDLGKVKHG